MGTNGRFRALIDYIVLADIYFLIKINWSAMKRKNLIGPLS